MKRWLSILIAALLMLGCFASASADTLAAEKPTLKYLGYNISWDPNTDQMAAVYEETTGYHVEYNVLPAENADEKLMMEVSSGANYDVLQVSPTQFQMLLSQGALRPLTDLLNEYGKDILAGVSQESWTACSSEDGQIYGIPYKVPYPSEIGTFMVCRLDLMEQAGVTKIPTTIDEFYDCLVALKAKFGDEYILFTGPFRVASEAGMGVSWDIPQSISSAFGIYADWMVDDSGKVIYMTEHENYPKMIEFFNKLMSEGLLDKDWAVNNTTTVNEKLSSGKAIIACSNRTGAMVTTPVMMSELGLAKEQIGYIGALSDAEGNCKYMKTEAINQVTCILKSCKNAADVINWINIKQQNQLFLNIGVEGVHFNYDAEGAISPINPIFAEERGNSFWYINSTDEAEFAVQWPSRVRKSDAMWWPFYEITIKTNQEHPEIFVPNTFAFMPSLPNYSKYNQSLFKGTSDFTLQLIASTKTLEKDFDAYKSDWAINGGEDVRAEMQAWYDSFYVK